MKLSDDKVVNAMFVSLAYAGCCGAALTHTSGLLNPAIGWVQAVVVGTQIDDSNFNEIGWIYSAGPFVGGLVGGFFWMAIQKAYERFEDLAKKLPGF